MKRVTQFSVWIIALVGLMIASSAQAADKTPPTPGGYVSGYPKAVGTTSIEVKWKRATDNQTQQKKLRYQVVWKKKSSSGDWAFSHPNNKPKDMTEYIINGLESNTEYVVNVWVEDEVGNGKWYGKKTVKTRVFDKTDPMPGSYVSGYPKAISPTEIRVKWTPATDNVTPQDKLRYLVCWKKSWEQSYFSFGTRGTVLTIGGLEPDTKYVVMVCVEDESENWNGYGNKTVTTPGSDKTPPMPGSYEAGYPKAVGKTIEMKWTPGSDNVTAQKNLRYAVKWKKNGSLSVWKHSPITKDMTSYTLTGLEPKTIYIVNVVVEDEAGNSKWYGVKTVKTQAVADKTPPAFNAGAKLNVDNVTETSVTLSWPKATDDHTPQNKIRYEWSIVGPLCAWPLETDIDSHTFTHLTPGETYRFRVRAADEAGNWNIGLTTEVTTKKKAKPDNEPPYFPNGQALSVTATETSLSLSWPAAADKVTATSNLKYCLYFKRSNESVWPVTRLGKNVLKHTCTGLLPDTEYDICVAVFDEASNRADYTWVLKTKTKASTQTVHPASVTIAPASLDLEVGAKATPTATVLPINAADKTVTWSSNNTAVASVDPATGEVTALAPGKAEITATANDKTDDGTKSETIEVRVKAKATSKLVTDVAVMPAVHILNVGDIFYYTGIVQPDDATDKGLTWMSSDPTVATITGGFVNALQAGTVTITATAKDGSGQYGTGTLTIKDPSAAGAATSIVKATGIVVDQPSITLAEGGTATLSARVLPADATNKGYTWSSSDPEVASVSSDGVVTAHRAGGSALITATADDGGWTDFCAIHIKGTSVMLTPSAFTLEPGESLELIATTAPWDSPMTKSFSSNRPSVAQVDKGGIVKAVAEGEAIITVTLSGGQKATCRISVQKSGTTPDANETIVDQSAARAWTANGTLYIVTDEPADVEVLNFSGIRLKKFRAPAGTTTVNHLPQGVYIVRVGERVTKVALN